MVLLLVSIRTIYSLLLRFTINLYDLYYQTIKLKNLWLSRVSEFGSLSHFSPEV